MTFPELTTVLESTGLPVTYRAWPEQQAPALPYICYLADYSENFGADNRVYYPITRVRVELYTECKQPEAEERVEAAFFSASLFWQKTEVYIDSENCYQIAYEIEV